MRSGSIALLIVTWLHGTAVAGPVATPAAAPDPDGTVTAPATPSGETPKDPTESPWIDLAPATILTARVNEERSPDRRLASGLTLAGLYAGFWGWAYLAWYRNHPEKDEHDFGRDGWFGVKTYAGGADKLGHAWATMVLARGGNALLDWGGWKRTHSALISAAMSELLFLGVEIKDYYYYEFSPGDFTFNTLGALAAVAFDLSPRLDELFDFRVEYGMSEQYRNNLFNSDSPCKKREPGQPSCSRWNIAEDYSGETFLLAMHLGGIHQLRDMKYGVWSRFVDVAVGFESRNYKPPPTLIGGPMLDMPVERRQTLFLGVTFNVQGLVDYLLPTNSTWRKIGHGLFEVATPSWTRHLPTTIETTRTTSSAATGGA